MSTRRSRETSRAAAVAAGLVALVLFPAAAGGELRAADISPPGSSASPPRLAADGSGTAVAVWRELAGDEAAVRAAVRRPEGAWTPSQQISTPSIAIEEPEVAMDRLGNAVAVWHRSTTGRDSVVEAATRPAGGSWGAAQQVSAADEKAYGAAVAVEAGRVTVAYVALNGFRQVVRAATRSIAGAWSTPVTISDPVSNAFRPDVAMDDAGGAAATWQWFDGASLVVQAAVRPPGAAWQPPETLSGPGQDALHPKIELDAEGDAVAAWLRSNGSWDVVQSAARPAGGAWEPPKNLSIRSGGAAALDLAMNRRGDAAILWKQARGAGGFSDLWSAFRPADAARWSSRILVSEGWRGLRAAIALDEAGNATAAWAGSATISASFRPAGSAAWQDDYLLSAWEANATHPDVVTHAPRSATAVWLRTTGEDDRVQAVAYDVTTSAEENEDGDDEDGAEEGEDDGQIFRGTSGPDTLIGTRGDDVFYGFAGADRIEGRGGRDRVYAGDGNDVVIGGRGRDRLFGGAGRDRLHGGGGADLVVGDTGRDVLHGGAGNDALLARDGLRDSAFGGRGLDRYRLDRWLDGARSVESRY